jgi:tRNA (guanine-N7-)-methyltransferase
MFSDKSIEIESHRHMSTSVDEHWEAPDEALEVILADILSPLVWSDIFASDQAVEVDLGSGSGKFLVEAAQKFPGRNFLGVERLLGRVRKTRRRAFRLGITNLRVLRMEIQYTVRYLFPKESISRFHLSFPDPWPKRRHHVRRVIDRDFFGALWSALVADGEVRIKTDHDGYFQQIVSVAEEPRLWHLLDWIDEGYPITNFEQDFLARNSPIHRLRLVKRNSAPRNV